MTDEIESIARRHGVSAAAAVEVLDALRRGGGTLAQFTHPDLGGRGQWMPGMVQVGAMFDDALKARVSALCSELAALARRTPAKETTTMEPMKPMEGMRPMEPMKPMEPAKQWWPDGYGRPNATGGQNDVRYAYFGDKRRLLVDTNGQRQAYDTADHQITGIAQSQGDTRHLVFTSQHGPVPLDTLRKVDL